MHPSTIRRIQLVKQILAEKYEPGRQDRNKSWVLRTEIKPLLGISRRTFSRYINTPDKLLQTSPSASVDVRQLSLFDDYPEEFWSSKSTTEQV